MTDIFFLPLTEFTEETIRDLIDDKINESLTLDYKRQLGSTKELAKDVSSFANTRGGILIFGVETDSNDIPIKEYPLQRELKMKESLENRIITSMTPRINDLMIREIPCESDESTCFIVIKVPPSPDAPHYVTKNNDRRFYKRYNFQSVPMDEYEIEVLYEKRLRLRKGILDQLKAATDELSTMEYEGFSRLYCIAHPISVGRVMFDLSDIGEAKQLLGQYGLTCIRRGGNPIYHMNGYYLENAYGKIGFNEEGTISLSTPLILREEDEKLQIIPTAVLIAFIFHFLQTCVFLYGQIGFFWKFDIQITLSAKEKKLALPEVSFSPRFSAACMTDSIQLNFSNQVENITDEEKCKVFVKEIISKIVGYFRLPPSTGNSLVNYVAQRDWR